MDGANLRTAPIKGATPYVLVAIIITEFKVQMKCFFIAEFERAAKIRKIAVYRFLIYFVVPEL